MKDGTYLGRNEETVPTSIRHSHGSYSHEDVHAMGQTF